MLPALAQKEVTPGPTVNILIDVSGSMQQNDPENLRIPAVKLLINLLPDDTQVGIWLFAEKTRLLTKTAAVDKKWKKKALAASGNIHSRGLLTDIENAIQTVLRDGFGDATRKHLILLTDGMVDISKDIMESADSRERVISELIPVLQQRRIEVETIALSDQADKELLDRLAFDTNGWVETAQSAEQLQKTFLSMFNQVLPPETVPLRDNKFNIDRRVSEFSLLVFKKTDAPPTRLLNPEGRIHSRKDHAENISWVEEKFYDLVTVRRPRVGEWTVEAALDPANQVMVLTDLKLGLEDIPSQVVAGEEVDVIAHFTEQDELIVREDFLRLLNVSLLQTDALKRKSEWQMRPLAGKPGYFAHTVGATLDRGRHTLRIIADGKTFQRQQFRTIEVKETLVRVDKAIETGLNQVFLELLPDKEVIEPANMTVTAIINYPDKPIEMVQLSMDRGRWLLTLPIPRQGQRLIVNFDVMARTVRGNPVTPKIKPVVIDHDLIEKLTEQTTPPSTSVSPQDLANVTEQADNVTDKPEKSPRTDHNKVPAETDKTSPGETEGSWGVVVGIVAAVNVLLAAGGFWSYKRLKGRTAEKQEKLLDRLT